MSNPAENRVFEFNDFRLDAATKILYRNGEQVVLTPKAVETLIAFAENPGKVISKDELMEKIWSDTIVEESNLAQYLHILRKTLGNTDDGKPYIETLKRRGYRFNGEVRIISNDLHDNGFIESLTDRSNAANPGNRHQEFGGVRHQTQAAVAVPETAPRINVERTDNVYSVTDWQREPAVDTEVTMMPPTRSKWTLPLIIIIAVVTGLTGIVFGIYKFSPTASIAQGSVPFRGSDITRVTTSGNSKRSAISPDGRYIAHVSGGTDGDSIPGAAGRGRK
ncbi:MAG: transcriptional regulator [Pyrinomonadaceae bacterium]